MKLLEPRYSLIESQFSRASLAGAKKEWLFECSSETYRADSEFSRIVEEWEGLRGLTSELRSFLKRYPWHYEAMSQYAKCKIHDGRDLDGLAFAQTAVSIAKAAFPAEFKEGWDYIPGGFPQNRPFLQSLLQLMIAQGCVGLLEEAAATGFQILSYDRGDRVGTRMELPKILLKLGRFRAVVELFADPDFKGTFYTAEYLLPLAWLSLGDEEKARAEIDYCLTKPRIAKYLLNPDIPLPNTEKASFGLTSGSELEGFVYANEFREFWTNTTGALKILRERSTEAEEQGWPAFMSTKRQLEE